MSIDVKDLAWLCSKAEQEKLLDDWLRLLFTPSELEDLNKRLDLITALIKNEETQREIAKNHEVSIAKITRGSNALKISSPELRVFLEKNLK